jgi:hypothetical protein
VGVYGFGCEEDEYTRDSGIICDLSLASFVGADGLMPLMALLPEDRVPLEEGLEMIKRLHIPGCEPVRLHLEQAISDNVYEPNTVPGSPQQYQIGEVLEWLSRR